MKKLLALCLFSLLVSGGAFAHEHEKGHDDHDKTTHDSADAPHKDKKTDKDTHSDHHAKGEKHDGHDEDSHHDEDGHH